MRIIENVEKYLWGIIVAKALEKVLCHCTGTATHKKNSSDAPKKHRSENLIEGAIFTREAEYYPWHLSQLHGAKLTVTGPGKKTGIWTLLASFKEVLRRESEVDRDAVSVVGHDLTYPDH